MSKIGEVGSGFDREIKVKINISTVPITAKKVQFGQHFLHKMVLPNTSFRREHRLCLEEKKNQHSLHPIK